MKEIAVFLSLLLLQACASRSTELKKVAQYVHVDSLVKEGAKVRRGEVIGKTSKNGFICSPQLHFGIYKSRDHLYTSPKRQTVPLYFNGFPDGELKEGRVYRVK